MSDAAQSRSGSNVRVTAEAAVAVGELRQLASGQAGVSADPTLSFEAGQRVDFKTDSQWVMPKATGFVGLDGGRAYWDYSAAAVTFRKVGDRDFYLGRFVGDSALTDTTCTVALNVDPAYDLDLARDAYLSVPIGTQALGGFLPPARRGGTIGLVLSSTSEAQKVDALSVDTFSKDANAIVEFAFTVPSDGAGTVVDLSVGIASATHATDADSITQHLLMHLDANATAIKFQSKDGTTTVTATDSTKTYTEGAALANRKEVWFDMRNPADVQIYVDGVNVLPATVFNVNAAASEWKLLLHAEKTSSTDTYELDLHWLRVRLAKQ
jgi:hypothetical protein